MSSENIFDELEDEPVMPGATPEAAPEAVAGDLARQSPFEALFNLNGGSTPVASTVPVDALGKIGGALIDPTTGEIVEQTADATEVELAKEDRLEDLKIQGQLDTIHDAAMGAFHQQQALSQEVEPKFSARNSEVAAQYLGIALNAVTARATQSNNRQKIRIAKNTAGAPGTVNNNVIVADRNTVLRSLFKPDFEKPMGGSDK